MLAHGGIYISSSTILPPLFINLATGKLKLPNSLNEISFAAMMLNE